MTYVMKRTGAVLLAITLVITGIIIPINVRANDVESIAGIFPDINLAEAIAAQLQKDVNDEITQEDLDSIQILDANERGIKSIEGIDRLNQMTTFSASENEIEDLIPFNAHNFPNLEVIMLTDNKIKNILPLTHLTGLNQVFLEYNNIEDVSQMRFSPSNDPETNTGTAARIHSFYVAEQTVEQARYRERSMTDKLLTYDEIASENQFFVLYEISDGGESEEDSNIVTWKNLPAGAETLSYEFANNYRVQGGNWTYSGIKEIQLLNPEIIVRYEDEAGEELLPEYEKKGEFLGDQYETAMEAIANYELKEVKGDETGVYTAEEQVVTYIYQRIPTTGKVITNYVAEDHAVLKEATETIGLIGTPFTTMDAEIEDYKVKEIIGATTGVYTRETQELTYVYMKNETPIVTPPSVVNPPTKPREEPLTPPPAAKSATPKTGDSAYPIAIALGSFLVGALAIAVQRRKRKGYN